MFCFHPFFLPVCPLYFHIVFIIIILFFYICFFGPPYCYVSSRYAGARWSLRKPEFRVNLGAQVLGTALNSLRFASCLQLHPFCF